MQFDELKRREFITLLGGTAAAWPLAARAQQHTIPVVGFLYSGTPEAHAHRIAGFRKGLGEAGYVEGHNLTIEYRFAHNEFERLPELAADLVRRRVSVLAALGNAATALAAKDATTSTPVVFAFGGDPIQLGFVASFNRPGGNLTGMSLMNVELAAKHIGLMHELLPRATRFALLINPSNPSAAEIVSNDAQAAGRAIGRQIDVIAARTAREIDEAFASLMRQGAAGLLVAPDTFFIDRRVRPGQSPEEMERYVTIPIEIAIASTPGLKYIRSNTVYALSFIRLQFEYGRDYHFVRQQTINRLREADLPQGVQPVISPAGTISEIFRYELKGPPGMDVLRELENISVGHGVSLLCWRSGGVEHPHDTPPYPFTPSPTFAHSSS
jgi:ABC-type uncharacterized transport system substrate-binding protein